MTPAGLKFYGVVARPERNGAVLAPQTSAISVRDLSAIVKAAPFTPVDPSAAEVADYRGVVESAFDRGSILPAPFGVVFRSHDQVEHWLQMNYIALTEGMHLVQGRCEVRIHVTPEPEPAADEDDVVAVATEVFRTLRRRAAASVPLRRTDTHLTVSSAFLVERTLWEEFAKLVGTQARRYQEVHIGRTGPWPPYAFVRMDLAV
jgi:hypothetical protein